MADIVERLRFDAVRCELHFSKGVAGNIKEAADEIERLRAINQAADADIGEIERLMAKIERLQAALKPFADYADKRHIVPGSMVITNGSALAKGQLTMAHCYHAAAALEQSAAAEGK